MLNYILSFIAGLLSILSPCILPLLPILITSGLHSSKKGVLGLPAGIALSFTVIGISLAYAGHVIGLNSSNLSIISSILLILFGLILCSKYLQNLWIKFSQNISASFNNQAAKIHSHNFYGQFIIGILLGIAWTPCIGPTIGAAITLAAKGQQLIHAAIIMILFALGATLPVVIMAFVSKKTLFKFKALKNSSYYGRFVFGILLIVWGIGLLFNFDKYLSTWILPYIPDRLFRYI